jgi:uncharacterized protein (DUF885 family)
MTASSAPSLHAFFEAAYEERIARSPQTLATLGIKRSQDRLDDYSDEARQEECRLVMDQLDRLKAFDADKLDEEDRLSYDLFAFEAEQFLEAHAFRHNHYLVNQKFGLHSDFPAFMINMHRIDSVEDAQNYIARLQAFDLACAQVIAELERRQAKGIVPPVFLFDQMIGDCRAFVGADQTDATTRHNPLYRDFQDKLERLESLAPSQQADLLAQADNALAQYVLPSYARLARFLEDQQRQAPEQGGAWSLPDGEAFYAYCLRSETTTSLTAEEVHQLGLQEMARIHRELATLQPELGVAGELTDLLEHARVDPSFYYPQTPAGRRTYLEDLQEPIDRMAERLDTLFTRLPEDALLVKPVEPHREKTAGLAFYQVPASDGSRPGIFHINLHDMGQLPNYITEALAFHEALPGHHMQFAIANRLHQLPAFRRAAWYNAYIEGWGLYAEQIAYEIGAYTGPWDDFGRLVQELKRACRLVVDTGIHAHRWSRSQAIEYLHDNVPVSRAQATMEIDRYLVMPAQATSYKVGMEELLRLRSHAQESLGDRFDLRLFHDELLRHGALPLDILERQVARWIGGQLS